VSSKSYNGIKLLVTRYYEESKIFPDGNITAYDNYKDGSSNPKRNNYPSDEENSKYPGNMTATDGFGRPIPNTMTDNNNEPKRINDIRDNLSNINNDPKYATSPNFRGPPNSLGQSDRIGVERTQAIGSPGTGSVGPNYGSDEPNYVEDGNQKQLPSTQSSVINKSLASMQMNI
jgi:hypothetical protein